jgi:hypothetical protein
MTFAAVSPCCPGSTEQAQSQGIASSLSNLVRSIFCSCANEADKLGNHAASAEREELGGNVDSGSEKEGPGDFLPEGSLTEEAANEQPLTAEEAEHLAEKMRGPVVIVHQ